MKSALILIAAFGLAALYIIALLISGIREVYQYRKQIDAVKAKKTSLIKI